MCTSDTRELGGGVRKTTLCGAVVLFVCGFALGQAQYKVLYNFCSATSCADGGAPQGKLVLDSSGNLYGTTAGGGSNCQQNDEGGCGTVFELSPTQNGNWTETVLYSFCINDVQGCPDGYEPTSALIFDNAGNLYGTTQGGGAYGLGTVFELSPPANRGGSWTEAVLWGFGAPGDGAVPVSDLIFDASGNLYGTTSGGGAYVGWGTVFQLVSISGGRWSENILFSFGADISTGVNPKAGMIFDRSGNLYGTTWQGGLKNKYGIDGVVYKLSPKPQVPWTETVLFEFTGATGGNPLAGVVMDKSGNLYGSTQFGEYNNGSVFRLTSQGREHGILFEGTPNGAFPAADLLMDEDRFYGTTQEGGSQNGGTVFKVQGTTETVLYSFCSQPSCADGSQPEAALISRAKSLFGTTATGGTNGKGGVVFEISETAPGGK
jgi:uncharacterized repeat protein (TIGR03803 family)